MEGNRAKNMDFSILGHLEKWEEREKKEGEKGGVMEVEQGVGGKRRELLP